MGTNDRLRLNRRDLLKWGGAVLLGSVADPRAIPAYAEGGSGCRIPENETLDELFKSPCFGEPALEVYPTSPLIGGYVDSNQVVKGSAFTEPLPMPTLLRPVPLSEFGSNPPGPGLGQQASDRSPFSTHQIWPTDRGMPDPRTHNRLYRIKLQVRAHRFTNLKALPINAFGQCVSRPGGTAGPQYLPGSTIYGFNGTFPGPMINAEYGKPLIVRFENHLHENPFNLDRNDFGDPHFRFLTHLHNGHTAPESDGNPHFRFEGYNPYEFVDNLYLNYPAGGDDKEKQSFFWFHDHFEGHTGAHVYKGLVGLYPIYDPKLDYGNENDVRNADNLRLPGVRRDNPDGTFQVDYDIPLAFYDCRLDDGVTPHKDFHNGCGETHPEWWGQTYFRHFPDRGFNGDVFTVNGAAYPVLHVQRRKYRFRFLDASVARVYKFKLMSSTGGPKAAPGVQGQYQLPDGQQCMRFTQIASEGGLLPFPIVRDSFELWPSKRKEVIVDFSKYMDGSPTTKYDEIYLVNVQEMADGRKHSRDFPNYRVPLLKIVIGDWVPDNSQIPNELRELPDLDLNALHDLPHRDFLLERGGTSGGLFDEQVHKELSREYEWTINGNPFNICEPLAFPKMGRPEVWTIRNDGGGWVHPMHFHMEEHRIISKNGVPISSVTPLGADDAFAKEDTVALGPNEEIVFYRNFRTFKGPYVAHCHNLAHEDHSMMFAWRLVNLSGTT